MHFQNTIRTPTVTTCRNIKIFKEFFSTPRQCQKSFSKSTSKIGDDTKNIKKPSSPIFLPPPDYQILQDTVKKKKDLSIWTNIPGAEKLIHVTDNNVEKILKKHKSILIMFYGTWCSVCRDVNREIAKAASELNPKTGALGICDAMDNVALVDKYMIRKTPSLKYFSNGIYTSDFLGMPLKAESIIAFMESPPTIRK